MSEKPFWEGKTLMEIQNLDKRVKVTMENGDVFIGKLVRRSRDADGMCSLSMQLDAHRTYLHVFSAESFDTQPVIPSYVDTVELLDDPNYERIEEADDLQEKDIAVTLDGNRYKVTDVEKAVTDSGVGYTALSGRNVSPLTSTPSPTGSVRNLSFLTVMGCGSTRTVPYGWLATVRLVLSAPVKARG